MENSGNEAKSSLKGFWKAFLLRSLVPFGCLIFILVALIELRSSFGQYKTAIVGEVYMPEVAEPNASILLIPSLSDAVDWPLGTDTSVGGTFIGWGNATNTTKLTKDGDNYVISDQAERIGIDWSNNQKWLAELKPGEDSYEYAKLASGKTLLKEGATEKETAEFNASLEAAGLREMQLDVSNFRVNTSKEPNETVFSETGLMYRVRIRSLNIIPLDFTLVYTNDKGEKEYYRAEKQSVVGTAEYIFHKVNFVTETKTVDDKEVQVVNEVLDTAEAAFYMDGPEDWVLTEAEKAEGGKKITDRLKLYVGWATTGEDIYNSAYRKEVDRLKVMVNIANTSSGDSRLPETAPTVTEPSTEAPPTEAPEPEPEPEPEP